MTKVLVEDCGTYLSKGIAGDLRAAGFDAQCASEIMVAIREQAPDLAIVLSVSEYSEIPDTANIKGTALIAVLRRRNSYLESCLRRQGIHCILMIETIDIVRIAREILNR